MDCGPDSGYIKLWRKALHNGSSLRELSATQRWVFLAYTTAARWKEPYRGALCEPDGTPWSRTKRAEIAGVTYECAKRAEEAMEELGMVVIDRRGATGHHNSQGRLRVVNYDDYQAKNQPLEPEDEPTSGIGGSTSETGGNQPPKPEDGTLDESSSENGGSNDGKPVGNGIDSEPTFDNSSSENGGSDSQEGNKNKQQYDNGDGRAREAPPIEQQIPAIRQNHPHLAETIREHTNGWTPQQRDKLLVEVVANCRESDVLTENRVLAFMADHPPQYAQRNRPDSYMRFVLGKLSARDSPDRDAPPDKSPEEDFENEKPGVIESPWSR